MAIAGLLSRHLSGPTSYNDIKHFLPSLLNQTFPSLTYSPMLREKESEREREILIRHWTRTPRENRDFSICGNLCYLYFSLVRKGHTNIFTSRMALIRMG